METSYPMLRKLSNASRLSLQDWLFFIEAWFWLLVFDIGLCTQPFPKLQAFAARLERSPTLSTEQADNLILALCNAVDHACYNHLYPMTCLRRSLTLQKMLAAKGIVTKLKIGVRKEAYQFSAHAWLEYQGRPLGEAERILGQYSELIKAETSASK